MQDHIKIVYDQNTSLLLQDYLNEIRIDQGIISENLKNCILRSGEANEETNVHILDKLQTPKDLLQYLLRTKEPVIFGERHVKGDGSDWNEKESKILAGVSVITKVSAYDNGASGGSSSNIKLEQFKEPSEQYIINISGPILKEGTDDHREIVKDGNIDYKIYYKKIERMLLPALLAQNEVCNSQKKKAVITIPGIGCGEFAGDFKGIMGTFFNTALQDILQNYSKEGAVPDKIKMLSGMYEKKEQN